nr:hypothetical protein [uncultured Desulfobacter sp.]
MDITRDQIEVSIVACIERLNMGLVESGQITIEPDHVLFGEGSHLDSMGLLNLLMDLEDGFDDQGIQITILDDHALSQKNSPFRTISGLSQYILEKVKNEC